MRFSPLLFTLGQLTAVVVGARICAYSTRGCIGAFACCSNIGKYTCCVFPQGLGWGTLFSDVPSGDYGWWARTFTDQGCINSLNGGSMLPSSGTCTPNPNMPSSSDFYQVSASLIYQLILVLALPASSLRFLQGANFMLWNKTRVLISPLHRISWASRQAMEKTTFSRCRKRSSKQSGTSFSVETLDSFLRSTETSVYWSNIRRKRLIHAPTSIRQESTVSSSFQLVVKTSTLQNGMA